MRAAKAKLQAGKLGGTPKAMTDKEKHALLRKMLSELRVQVDELLVESRALAARARRH